MPATFCPRCQRANPAEAVYCHFDGMALRTGGPRTGHGTLTNEFVFSSGRKCRTYDELVQGCQYEWEEARSMLRAGVFSQYLASIGRMDLVQAARGPGTLRPGHRPARLCQCPARDPGPGTTTGTQPPSSPRWPSEAGNHPPPRAQRGQQRQGSAPGQGHGQRGERMAWSGRRRPNSGPISKDRPSNRFTSASIRTD